MLKIIFLILFISVNYVSFSQVENPEFYEKNNLRTNQLAKEALRVGDYYLAISHFEEIYKRDTNNIKIIGELADLYRFTNNYKQAESFYLKLIAHHKITKKAEVTFYLAQMKKCNGKHNEALQLFLGLKKQLSLVTDETIKKLYKTELEGCQLAISYKDSTQKFLVNTLGDGVNNPHIDFSPIPLSDQEIIFGTYPEKKELVYDALNSDSLVLPKRKLFYASKKSEKWQAKGEIFEGVNDPMFDVANGAFSSDSMSFYFTKCAENWQYKTICHIYVMHKQNGTWGEAEKLNELINIPDFTSSHPAIGRNFKTNADVLYFVSDREGSKGGMDIWMAEYDPRKKDFKKPKNCGSSINSLGDEMSPYFDLATKTLYFSSNGKPNIGGFDVFKSTHDGRGWIAPINLGTDINSPADDLDFVLKPSGKGGFFVSNRKGGKSLYHETCCDDIYEFDNLKYINQELLLSLIEADNKECLKKGEKINVYIKENDSRFLVESLKSGDCINKIQLRPGFDYVVEVNKEGYFNNETDLSTKNINESKTFEKTLELKKRPVDPIVLENVHFEFNSANLTKESKEIIDTTLIRLCMRDPQVIFEVSAHTDNKGSDDYNLKLSQKRAESIIKYLKDKGMNEKQFKAVGYGETKPVAPNSNPDGSDNPTGREKNRRVEFKFIGELAPDDVIHYHTQEHEEESKKTETKF